MAAPQRPPTVLIIGCGIAGPVLAVLLKRKGYHPIIFEKVRALGDAGASLMLMPNGMKVLDLVGLNAADLGSGSGSGSGSSFPLDACEDRAASSGGSSSTEGQNASSPPPLVLGSSALPSTFRQKYGQPAVGVKRADLNLALKRLAADGAGIEVREGWALESISEDAAAAAVTARFANGEVARGDFLVGCDGIKSASRDALLEMQRQRQEGSGAEPETEPPPPPPPSFTGLTQTSGFSPTPASLGTTTANGDKRSVMRNWFGEGAHAIAYPVSRTHVSWAVTLPEEQEAAARESWRLYGGDEREEVKRRLLDVLEQKGFEAPVLEMVRSAER
ncbi:hypothetical protein SLS62_009004, partial [Diatrype stigma]